MQHKSKRSHHQLNPFAGGGGGGIAAQTGGGGTTFTGSGFNSTWWISVGSSVTT